MEGILQLGGGIGVNTGMAETNVYEQLHNPRCQNKVIIFSKIQKNHHKLVFSLKEISKIIKCRHPHEWTMIHI